MNDLQKIGAAITAMGCLILMSPVILLAMMIFIASIMHLLGIKK